MKQLASNIAAPLKLNTLFQSSTFFPIFFATGVQKLKPQGNPLKGEAESQFPF